MVLRVADQAVQQKRLVLVHFKPAKKKHRVERERYVNHRECILMLT